MPNIERELQENSLESVKGAEKNQREKTGQSIFDGNCISLSAEMVCFAPKKNYRARRIGTVLALAFLLLAVPISPGAADFLGLSGPPAAEAGALQNYEKARKDFDRIYSRIKAKTNKRRSLDRKRKERDDRLNDLKKKLEAAKREGSAVYKEMQSIDFLIKRVEEKIRKAKKDEDLKNVGRLEKKRKDLQDNRNDTQDRYYRLASKRWKMESAVKSFPPFDERPLKKVDSEIRDLNKRLTDARDRIKKYSDLMSRAENKVFRMKLEYEAELRALNWANIRLSKTEEKLRKKKHEMGKIRNKYIPKEKKDEIARREKKIKQLKVEVEKLQKQVKKDTEIYDAIDKRVKKYRKAYRAGVKELKG